MIKRIIKEWVLPTILVAILVGFGYRMSLDNASVDYVKATGGQMYYE